MRTYKRMCLLMSETIFTLFSILFLVLWMLFYVAFPFFLFPFPIYAYSYVFINAPFIALIAFIIFSQICYYLRQKQD